MSLTASGLALLRDVRRWSGPVAAGGVLAIVLGLALG